MSTTTPLTDQEWQVRHFIYQFFVENAHPPSAAETAAFFGIEPQAAIAIYHRLHDFHQLFLNPGTDDVLIANPLSAVPTLYKVNVNGKSLWANCAWDSLGIPVMLHSDAEIEALNPLTKETIRYRVASGQLEAPDYPVHFALPAARWYDDLIDT